MKRANIHVTGIVQGVGFRPFVYRVANKLSLVGYVLNLGDAGVRIVVEGSKEKILAFIREVRNNLPSIAHIDSIDVDWKEPDGKFESFSIEKSLVSREQNSVPKIPPDIAICEDCVRDLMNPESRWYLYPFTSCAACGPRYSTITSLPYDRPNTTMIDFPLCDNCNTGYTSPLDRRYHAQTTACKSCGPFYQLLDKHRNLEEGNKAIALAADLIQDGNIIAIQGIGGTHLVTMTTNPEPIKVLRKRKRRLQRPFAIMVKDTVTLATITRPTKLELELMESWRRPIVLLRKATQNPSVSQVSNRLHVIPQESLNQISPGLDTIGIMFPYAPLHHLLFSYLDDPALVMTSANPTGIPMYIESNTILKELNDIADYFLIHNRRIHQRIDDSVLKVTHDENPVFIRKARGYVPEPLIFEGPWKNVNIVAVGPEEKATGSICKAGKIYTTQHIGDTDQVESIQFLLDAIDNMKNLLGVEYPDALACDLHPEFLSTEIAEKMAVEDDIPLHRIQHHYAHLASMIIDNNLKSDTNIVCITADGYGYGNDGHAWGGEVLVGNLDSFERHGSLKSQEYPGGDLSAKYAARPLLGILADVMELDELVQLVEGIKIAPDIVSSKQNIELLLDARIQGINTIRSTSAGRFLDAVSLVLGICSENSYDAECPMKLEAASKKSDLTIPAEYVRVDWGIALDTTESLKQIIELKRQGYRAGELAYAAQWHLGKALSEIGCQVAHNQGLDHVGFSGGVALNRIITKAIVTNAAKEKLIPLIHKQIPPGDGGVSVGQAVVAAERMSN